MSEIELVRGNTTKSVGNYRLNGGFEKDPDTFHVQYNPSTEPASEAIIRAVSFVHNVNHSELQPLGTIIDIDALNSIMDPQKGATNRPIELQFHYAELAITVTNTGNIWLRWEETASCE